MGSAVVSATVSAASPLSDVVAGPAKSLSFPFPFPFSVPPLAPSAFPSLFRFSFGFTASTAFSTAFFAFGDVFTSVFSCVLLAELAVGLDILSRKLPPGALTEAPLTRDLGRSAALVSAGSDGRDGCLRMALGLGAPGRSWRRVDGFLVMVEAGASARLGGRSVFAAEAAVGAVR